MSARSKRPDLGDLSGDPFDTFAGESEAPDPADRREAEEALMRTIHGLPAGSLSGGIRLPDDFDGSTQPGMEEFFGKPEEVNKGLTVAEKLMVYREGERVIEQASRQDFENARANIARNDEIGAQLWTDFQRLYPRHAARGVEAVEAAAWRAADAIQARGEDPRHYLEHDRDGFFSEVAYEMEGASGDAGGGQRTAGIAGGGGARPAPRQAEDNGDMLSDLHAIQRKGGFL